MKKEKQYFTLMYPDMRYRHFSRIKLRLILFLIWAIGIAIGSFLTVLIINTAI